METYAKLFASITDSSIWTEDYETRIVWVTMLAMCDQHGYVGASVPGLARRANVPLEATEKALAKFLAPDKFSRSQEFDGRRIEVADRGWTVINYERFRDMRDEEARKAYERDRKREQRKKSRTEKAVSQAVPDCPAVPAQSAHSQASASAEAQASAPKTQSTAPAPDAGEPESREMPCPLDFALHPSAVSGLCALGATEAQVLAEVREFVGYWTIGKGMGQRRRNWQAACRERIRKRIESGELGVGIAAKPLDDFAARVLAGDFGDRRRRQLEAGEATVQQLWDLHERGSLTERRRGKREPTSVGEALGGRS